MKGAVVRYAFSAVIDLAADILAFILAPIAALPCFIKVHPNGRERIRGAWQWITTHDAPIDTYAYGSAGRKHWLLKRFDVDNPANNPAWLRYANRVLWIWRNPAYQVSHWLGYDQRGVTPSPDRFKDPRWDTGEPNRAFWRVVNHRGQVGFLYQQQINWWRFTLEIQFGWKLYRRDDDQRCMLAFRFIPFKRYGR